MKQNKNKTIKYFEKVLELVTTVPPSVNLVAIRLLRYFELTFSIKVNNFCGSPLMGSCLFP